MNDNTILPIRFFLKEQYKELKDNGSFTGVNTFTGEEETVPDIPQALNCVADTTEQDIANIRQEVAEVKEQVANSSEKLYEHRTDFLFGRCHLFFSFYHSKETAFSSFEEFVNADPIQQPISMKPFLKVDNSGEWEMGMLIHFMLNADPNNETGMSYVGKNGHATLTGFATEFYDTPIEI